MHAGCSRDIFIGQTKYHTSNPSVR